ncbi:MULTISPECIES: PAS domain-containing sensor histidine kinase [Rubrivivax]|uniref:sensor histidine kinase n=1 Tax=Rubrivivax TaxID=28067 RepID=UPI00020A4DA7|nr:MULTISPECIES: PAS domain-containing sensor histidine kinase [Rubrivivax]EGJ11330.1 PAS/PAC sensor signal transduction histidine kinase [Rubrivivax benzoatilyticus JA2 = ATCC BAA-35]MCC9596670.1 PAS domain S-box protein [Rubrivivax sp. JA1055]MCC9648827.1 PAS domain S-box protein [Rubrivivax sp. JA1029]
MSEIQLRQRVRQRDRLVAQVASNGADLRSDLLDALKRGDMGAAEAALQRNDTKVRTLAEELRIYQAELHAQADELQQSRERTEQALSRFTTLFLGMPVASMLVSFNGEVIEHNGQAERLFAMQRQTMSARLLFRMVDSQQYQQRVRPAFHQARALGSITLDEVGFVAEDGRRFIGEMHLSTLPGDDETPQFAMAVIDRTEHIEDVRALRETTEALRVREAFLADTARLARIGGWEYDIECATMRWSSHLRRVFELSEHEPATLERTLQLCTPDGHAALSGALHAAKPGQAPFDFELDMHDAHGRALRVRVVGHAELGDDGPVVIGMFQDITAQAQARRQIGELTERLSVANDAGGIGVWDWDLQHGELYLDGRMRELTGFGDDVAPSDLCAALAGCLHAEDAPVFVDAVHHAVEACTAFGIELRLAPGPGGERWLHLAGRAHVEGGPAPRTVRLVGCAWDTTDEHQQARLLAAKQAAESANRAKTVFLSRVSHELRTPLNAILGFSQLMRLEAEAGDLVVKPYRVAMVEDAARHLLELVNELLNVSGIESGQLALKRVALDLRPLVRDCLQMIAAQAAEMQLTMDDRCSDGPPLLVLADPLRTKEVLLNLLSNAAKYNRTGGRITVSARHFAGSVELTVADTGRGLSEQQLAELFQPFSRAGAECSGIPGSGMGLYFSKRVVEAMGGRIEVESVAGERTAFTVALDEVPLHGAPGERL